MMSSDDKSEKVMEPKDLTSDFLRKRLKSSIKVYSSLRKVDFSTEEDIIRNE